MRAWWHSALRVRYDALFVANGTPPARATFEALRARCAEVIALDGGLRVLRRWQEPPRHIIGDLDSVTPADLLWAKRHRVRIHRRPSQESSDIEKGLAFCRARGMKHVLIAGVEGDRLDHVLNTLSACVEIKGIGITLVTRQSLILRLSGRAKCELEVPKTHTISWLGYPEARGCRLSGVAWPVANGILKLGGRASFSNLAREERVSAAQTSGVSLLIIGLRPEAGKRLLFSR